MKQQLGFYFRLLGLPPNLLLGGFSGSMIWNFAKRDTAVAMLESALTMLLFYAVGVRWGFARHPLRWFVEFVCHRSGHSSLRDLSRACACDGPANQHVSNFIARFEIAWLFAREQLRAGLLRGGTLIFSLAVIAYLMTSVVESPLKQLSLWEKVEFGALVGTLVLFLRTHYRLDKVKAITEEYLNVIVGLFFIGIAIATLSIDGIQRVVFGSIFPRVPWEFVHAASVFVVGCLMFFYDYVARKGLRERLESSVHRQRLLNSCFIVHFPTTFAFGFSLALLFWGNVAAQTRADMLAGIILVQAVTFALLYIIVEEGMVAARRPKAATSYAAVGGGWVN